MIQIKSQLDILITASNRASYHAAGGVHRNFWLS